MRRRIQLLRPAPQPRVDRAHVIVYTYSTEGLDAADES